MLCRVFALRPSAALLSTAASASVAGTASSSLAAAPRAASATAGLLHPTLQLRLGYEKIAEYYKQESFESLQKFEASQTYPGSIKASSPGDTMYPMQRYHTVLEDGDRHYWRAVVDDPAPARYVTIRIRFKENVCIGDRFELHAHVVPVSVPADATIATVLQTVIELNDSPYLCVNPIRLVHNGESLDLSQRLCDAGLSEVTVLDAIDDVTDHVSHEVGVKPLDWYADEMTPEVENAAPYAELKLRENITVMKRSPGTYRMQSKPPALSKHGDYRLSPGVHGKHTH